jgi:hypothetical protein
MLLFAADIFQKEGVIAKFLVACQVAQESGALLRKNGVDENRLLVKKVIEVFGAVKPDIALVIRQVFVKLLWA